jgi:hypothetical protein
VSIAARVLARRNEHREPRGPLARRVTGAAGTGPRQAKVRAPAWYHANAPAERLGWCWLYAYVVRPV